MAQRIEPFLRYNQELQDRIEELESEAEVIDV
ncbi:MAG: hypothetical protein ACI9R3_004510 [Verrucomicrobiales bacterium]|jgi:hypothetical protein